MVIVLFSNRLSIVPIRSKLQDDVLAGPIEGINTMGEKPELSYSDDEGSLNSNVLKEYIEEQGMEMYGITQNSNTSGVSGESLEPLKIWCLKPLKPTKRIVKRVFNGQLTFLKAGYI